MTYYKGLKIQDKRSLVVAISTALLLIATVVAAWYILAPQNSVRADAINTTDFVTTWKTDISEAGVSTIVLPMYGANYSVDWDNDGVYDETGLSGATTHDFGTPGTYTVRIGGAHGGWAQDPGMYPGNASKITEVNQWGDAQWQSMRRAFFAASNMVILATDAPDLSVATDMTEAFYYTVNMNQPMNHWDVSNITNMTGVFKSSSIFNQPLDNWDVSNVTTMYEMFNSAYDFNQPLDNWDVSSVTDTGHMFSSTNYFNQPLNNWDVSSVTDMRDMFESAGRFNQPLNNWDVSSVTNMSGLFRYTSNFNQQLNSWNVSNVTDMGGMFGNASRFNQPLNNWDVSSVTDMSRMFESAMSFNQSLSTWNVSNVTNMSFMFSDTTAFNQPLSVWNISNVTDIQNMFNGARVFNQPLNTWDTSSVTVASGVFGNSLAFDQDLSDWDVSNVVEMGGIFINSIVSPQNYDSTLGAWHSRGGLQSGLIINNHGVQYCDPSPTQGLTSDFGWTFYDSQQGCGMITVGGQYYNYSTEIGHTDNTNRVVIGEIEVAGFTPTNLSLTCTTQEYIDEASYSNGEFFEISNGNLVFNSPNPSADRTYGAVCIRASDDNGNFSESMHKIVVRPFKRIDSVSFGEYEGYRLLTVQGGALIVSSPSELGHAIYRSMVRFNNQDLPFCSIGTGVTASQFVDMFGMSDTSLVSDDTPCYRLFDPSNQTNPYVLTPTSAQIVLPADFDITAPGTVSVNNSPVFAFNQPTGGGGDDGGNGGDDNSGGSTGGSEDGGDNGNGPTYQETITVNGTKPIANQPVIPKKPTFTGTATPGARVVVTVHSDPVTCATIADANGDWSCTLPSDLEPGQHTVIAVITNPDGSIVNLGPYTVSVSGGGSTGVVIDSKTPLVPNTGLDIIEKLRQHQRTKSIQGYIVAAVLAGLAVVILSITMLSARRRKVVAFNRR